ncbi:hypothetical protein KM043_008490 [Ampulex compressa]|nr:hypothetical protein KM043_008490 [Ampulex compressa]
MEESQWQAVVDCLRKKKTAYLCRFIFCAKTTLNYDEIAQFFREYIQQNYTNSVTGLLLVHFEYVVHVIESPEDDAFQLCGQFLAHNSESVIAAKCLLIQNNVEERCFRKWYSRKTAYRDKSRENSTTEMEDSFDIAAGIYEKTILNLCKWYKELKNISNNEGYDKFLQRLEIFCEEGHPAIPDTEILNIILRSRWGYSLETLVNGYCDLYYPQDCDDSSSVAEILDSIKISLP